MDNTKHTPGPWKASFESFDTEWAIVTSKHGDIVANVNDAHGPNARLIAAAPDMYEALKNIANAGESGPLSIATMGAIKGMARQAISRVEGEL